MKKEVFLRPTLFRDNNFKLHVSCILNTLYVIKNQKCRLITNNYPLQCLKNGKTELKDLVIRLLNEIWWSINFSYNFSDEKLSIEKQVIPLLFWNKLFIYSEGKNLIFKNNSSEVIESKVWEDLDYLENWNNYYQYNYWNSTWNQNG